MALLSGIITFALFVCAVAAISLVERNELTDILHRGKSSTRELVLESFRIHDALSQTLQGNEDVKSYDLVSISGVWSDSHDRAALAKLISNLAQIKKIVWQDPVPFPIELAAALLERHSTAQVYIEHYIENCTATEGGGSHDPYEIFENPTDLTQCQVFPICPHSIKVNTWPEPWRLEELLTNCSNTRIFHFSIPDKGCIVSPPWSFRFNTTQGMLPPLEELYLNGYDFDGTYSDKYRYRYQYQISHLSC